MSLVVKRYKKLVKELLFAYSELEYIEEVLKDAHIDFENIIKIIAKIITYLLSS